MHFREVFQLVSIESQQLWTTEPWFFLAFKEFFGKIDFPENAMHHDATDLKCCHKIEMSTSNVREM